MPNESVRWRLGRASSGRWPPGCVPSPPMFAALTSQANGIDAAVAHHAAILGGLEELGRQVEVLADRLAMTNSADTEEAAQYQPVPPPRWWKLSGPHREAALDRLTAWVEQIYR